MATWAQMQKQQAAKDKAAMEKVVAGFATPEGVAGTPSSALFALPNLYALAGTIQEGIAPALGGIMDLGMEIDQYNQGQILSQLEEAMPGVTGSVSKASENISNFLEGIIPEDVQDAIARSSAFKSLSGGFQGSGMSRNLEARDLGLTSLDLMGRGSQELGSLLPTVRSTMTAQPYDIGVNIPTLSDLYNAAATQVGFNIQDVTSKRALAAAQSGAAQFSNVGGGGGGFSVNQGMPNLGAAGQRAGSPTIPVPQIPQAQPDYHGTLPPAATTTAAATQNQPWTPFPGYTFAQPNPNWQDTAVVGTPLSQIMSAVNSAIF